MKENNLQQLGIENRKKAVLELVESGKEPLRIERAAALLVLDILDALQTKAITLKEGCKCFVDLEATLDYKTRKRLSEEFRDLLNEAILLDEVGAPYGPDLTLMRSLVAKILQRDEAASRPQLRKFMSVLKSRQKNAKTSVAAV